MIKSSIPVPGGNIAQVLFVGRNLDLTSQHDSTLTKIFTGSTYLVTEVIAHCVSGGVTTACSGGVYTAISAGGTAIVAAGQSWLNLTASGKAVRATQANIASAVVYSASPLYFALTSGSAQAARADVFVFGTILD